MIPKLYRDRLIEAGRIMSEMGIDTLCLTAINMYYLTGFWTYPHERFISVFISSDKEPILVVPTFLREHARRDTYVDNIYTWSDEEGPHKILHEVVHELGIIGGKIAIDDRLWSSHLLLLQSIIPQAKYVSASSVLKEMRLRKSKEEIRLLRRACEIADKGAEAGILNCCEEKSEVEIAAAIEYEMRKSGSEGTSFETIVGSGPNSALPHHTAGSRRIQNGDVIVLDLGGIYKRYCSDITRTVCVEKPPEEVKRVYAVVKGAQQRAIDFIKPGVRAEEIDEVARNYIAREGYGNFFIHRTGHGIGLEDHEDPYLVGGYSVILKPGMTFSVEPGIYLPGKFGVRIEDIVVVTEDGCEVLNKVPKELIVL